MHAASSYSAASGLGEFWCTLHAGASASGLGAPQATAAPWASKAPPVTQSHSLVKLTASGLGSM